MSPDQDLHLLNKQCWYVYYNNHTKGPYFTSEIEDLILTGVVRNNHYIWTEGMPQWTIISEKSEFKFSGLGLDLESMTAIENSCEKQTLDFPDLNEIFSKNQIDTTHFIDKKSNTLNTNFIQKKTLETGTTISKNKYSMYLFERSLIALIIVSVSILTYSFLKFPKIDSINPEEYNELKAANDSSYSKEGPKGALAISIYDPVRPTFYLTTNLPKGSQVKVIIAAIPTTIVGSIPTDSEAVFYTRNHFTQTPSPVLNTGETLPMGEYRVRLFCISCQQAPLLLADKIYFIGGKKDQHYFEYLQNYQDIVSKNIQNELSLLKQTSDTLYNQYTELNQEHFKIAHLPTSFVKTEWQSFLPKWHALESQVQLVIQDFAKTISKNPTSIQTIKDSLQKIELEIQDYHLRIEAAISKNNVSSAEIKVEHLENQFKTLQLSLDKTLDSTHTSL